MEGGCKWGRERTREGRRGGKNDTVSGKKEEWREAVSGGGREQGKEEGREE